jgi:hypothetical protein
MSDIIELHERLKAAEAKIDALIELGIKLGHIKQETPETVVTEEKR